MHETTVRRKGDGQVNLRIGTVLPLIISVLVLMGVATAGFAAYQAFGRREDSEAFLEVNHISQLLLRSAGQWAVERGLTNAPLKSPDALPAELRPQIAETRQAADRAFSEAAQLLRGNPAMKSAGSKISEAESAFQGFVGFRTRLDENLPKRGSERSPDVVESFSPTITKLIDVSGNRLRLTLETLTRPPTAALTQLVSLRHLTAQMAENAGRERALLGG